MLLYYTLEVMKWLVIARAIASWFAPASDNPVVDGLRRATDPLLRPVQRVLPDVGGIDISPLVVYFGLRLLQGVVVRGMYL
jgi:YggT family protein